MTDLALATAGATVRDDTVAARAPWSAIVRAGQLLSIIDLGGNQAVECLLYDAADPTERYSAPDTITAQGSILLTAGTVLRSNESGALMTIVADDCGRHDTLGGACSRETNALRHGDHPDGAHACVESFLLEGAKWGLGRRDLVSGITWYRHLPLAPDGTFGTLDASGRPGLTITLRAERDVLVLLSNCPQPGGEDPVRVTLTAPPQP